MVIPRVLSRGSSATAQKAHFKAILAAAPELPAVIYNSPYYGFATRADLFFALRSEHPNLVGFKEFGGRRRPALRRREHHQPRRRRVADDRRRHRGVPRLRQLRRHRRDHRHRQRAAARGDAPLQPVAGGGGRATWTRGSARMELEQALAVLSSFDEGPDLVLYYKHLMMLKGEAEYRAALQRDRRADRQPAQLCRGAVRAVQRLVCGMEPAARRRAAAPVLGGAARAGGRAGLRRAGTRSRLLHRVDAEGCRRSRCSISRRLNRMPSASAFARAAKRRWEGRRAPWPAIASNSASARARGSPRRPAAKASRRRRRGGARRAPGARLVAPSRSSDSGLVRSPIMIPAEELDHRADRRALVAAEGQHRAGERGGRVGGGRALGDRWPSPPARACPPGDAARSRPGRRPRWRSRRRRASVPARGQPKAKGLVPSRGLLPPLGATVA